MAHANRDWQESNWTLVKHPAIGLVAAIALSVVATWYLVDTQLQYPHRGIPVAFGRH